MNQPDFSLEKKYVHKIFWTPNPTDKTAKNIKSKNYEWRHPLPKEIP